MNHISESITIKPNVELLFNDYASFDNVLTQTIEMNPGQVIFDFSEIPVMNSSSLYSFISFCKAAKSQNINLSVSKVHPKFQRTFDLLQLNQFC